MRAVRRYPFIMRIVSLLPSTTEILFALGAEDDVVGVTFECDFPPQARSRRIVSTSTLTGGLSPAEIDAEVRARLTAGEDLYHLDQGALRDLGPDLIVTQDLCTVCAVDIATVEAALDHLGCNGNVLTVDPSTLDEVLDSITTIGLATGRSGPARHLVANLRTRLGQVVDAVATRPRPGWQCWSGPTRCSQQDTGCPTWSRPPGVPACSAHPDNARNRSQRRPSPPPSPISSWSHPVDMTWPGRFSSPATSSTAPSCLPPYRCGRSTPTRHSFAPAHDSSMASKPSPLSATPGDSPLNLPLLRSFAVHRPSQPQLHGGDRQLPPHQPRHRHGCSSALGMYPRPTRSISFGSVPVTDGSLLRLAFLDPAFEQLDPIWGPGPVARHRAVL